MTSVLLAIDQGTTNTKALLVTRDGRPAYRTSAGVELLRTKEGHLEQDPRVLWHSVRDVAMRCVESARQQGLRIEGIALSNQRETALAWYASGEPAANAISWQCQRSSLICERLTSAAETIRVRSGLPLSPLLSAGKWAWLLENKAELRVHAEAGSLRLGTVDSWLLWNLTGGKTHATDASNASRTGLLNLADVRWDRELLGIFGIPVGALPSVCMSSGHAGVCTGLPELAGVPVVALAGDSHAALAGHGRYAPGSTKATYGTGSSLIMLADAKARHDGLARTIAWWTEHGVEYALEGNIPMTGAAVQWVGEFLGLRRPVEDAVALAETVPDAGGVVLVPAMLGLGAPYWDNEARGLIANLGRSHRAAHLARAALDAIAFQVNDVLLALESSAQLTVAELAADGGASRNAALMQMQADLLQRPVRRSICEDLSAIGAAWLGGLALGWWSSFAELAQLPRESETFLPSRTVGYRDAMYAGWQTAVERARLRSFAHGASA